MVNTTSQPTQYDSYEGWIGSGASAQDSWETIDGNLLGATTNGVYLPKSLGPYESDKEIPVNDLDEYVIKTEYTHNTLFIFLPFVISTVLIILWFIIGDGFGVLFFATGILVATYGLMKVFQERNRDTAYTHVTFRVAQYSTTITLIGDVKHEVHNALKKTTELDN